MAARIRYSTIATTSEDCNIGVGGEARMGIY